MTSPKAERRQERLRAEREREKKVAVTTPRLPQQERWGYWGIGALLLQLVRRPSFEHTVCYEVRDQNGSLGLFRSVSAAPGEGLVVGYDRIAVDPVELERLLQAIDALSIPIRTRLEPIAVLDGERYELAAVGGVRAVARLSWTTGNVPEGWANMADLVESTMRNFDSLDSAQEADEEQLNG